MPNIESRCNQLKLGHPLLSSAPEKILTSLVSNASRRAAYLEDLMELHIKAVSSILVAKYRNRDLTLWLVFELNGLILS